MKHLSLILLAVASGLELSAYNPYDSSVHTVGKFVYELDIDAGQKTGYATLIDVKPGTELTGEVTIPGSITVDGIRYEVNHIGDVYSSASFFEQDRAFKDFPGITRVNIPSTVTEIGNMEFLGCTGINEFHVNVNNKNFKDEDGVLFYRWNEVSSWRLFRMPPARPKTKYTLPDDVTRIESCAFADQKTLRQIILSPEFCFTEPLWAWGNKSIKEIDVSKTDFISRGGIVFEKWGDGVELIACPPGLKLDSYKVPDDCHTIGDGAFCNSSISHITLNQSLNFLREYAFAGSDIEELEVRANLLREGRVDLCLMARKLKKLHVTGAEDDKAYIERFSFALCSNLSEVILDTYNVEINRGAFYGCTSLKSFPFSNVLTMEGAETEYTYSGEGRQFQASGLISVEYPSILSKVPQYCFSDCPNLKEVTFNKDGGITAVLDNGAFENCASLETITLNGLTYVGGGVFDGTPIKKIIVPSREEEEGNLKIGVSFEVLPDTKWYIETPYVKWTTIDGSSNQVPATFVISSSRKIKILPIEWKQLYCPAGMLEWYESLYGKYKVKESVKELFSMEKVAGQSYITVRPAASLPDVEVEITGVVLNGRQAGHDGEGRWSHPEIKNLSGVEVRVDYKVDDVPMSTTYAADFTSGIDFRAIDSKVITGIYNTSGIFVGTEMDNLARGIYIVKFSDCSSEKIFVK